MSYEGGHAPRLVPVKGAPSALAEDDAVLVVVDRHDVDLFAFPHPRPVRVPGRTASTTSLSANLSKRFPK